MARCPEPACPVRYASGSDRPCTDHTDEQDGQRRTGTGRAAERGGEQAEVNTR